MKTRIKIRAHAELVEAGTRFVGVPGVSGSPCIVMALRPSTSSGRTAWGSGWFRTNGLGAQHSLEITRDVRGRSRELSVPLHTSKFSTDPALAIKNS
ncbi:MAG: hypothetical protein KC643_26670, partial [Nitrospira sp.]|nr:hypothetical protein [Nitrospira sp.]